MKYEKNQKHLVVEPVAKPAAKAVEPEAAEELTNETVPGGRYKGTDGTFHDANGNPIK